MNGTNTLVGPGAGDAALLRVKGTTRAIAVSLDGPGRLGALDPRLAGSAAVLEGALNVACSGAEPIGITNCLNFGSPEVPSGYWQLTEAVAGMADACRALGIPIVSGNVSLYNETADGPILPTPVIGTIGLLEDRSRSVPMRWSEGDAILLLGDPGFGAASLAASELAWRRGRFGGRPDDRPGGGGTVGPSPRGAGGRRPGAGRPRPVDRRPRGGLARMAIASGIGAQVSLPLGPGAAPMAAAFGERAGRVLLAVSPEQADAVLARAAAVELPCLRIGRAEAGALLLGGTGFEVSVTLEQLGEAWSNPF